MTTVYFAPRWGVSLCTVIGAGGQKSNRAEKEVLRYLPTRAPTWQTDGRTNRWTPGDSKDRADAQSVAR